MEKQVKQLEQLLLLFKRKISETPIILNEVDLKLHLKLLLEEFCETANISKERAAIVCAPLLDEIKATPQTNFLEYHDGLGDMFVILVSMMIMSGHPIKRVQNEIFASNMSKTQKDGSLLFREDGKILKGENYFPPNMNRALISEMPLDEFLEIFENQFYYYGLTTEIYESEDATSFLDEYLFDEPQKDVTHHICFTLFHNGTVSVGTHLVNAQGYLYLLKND